MNRILIIGIGNNERGDDSVGLLVARHMRHLARCDVETLELDTDPVNMLDAWIGFDNVYVIDCSAPIGCPGRIRRFDANLGAVPPLFSHLSSHDFGLESVIELARSLCRLPSRLIVYGIEGQQFRLHSKPCAVIKDAAAAATRMIIEDISKNIGPAECSRS